MKIKISNAITAALCAAVLSAASYSLGYADADTGGGTGYSSQGKIVFDNGTEDTADDVIFDASDFRLIDDMVTEGKTNIKNELNQYGNIQIDDDIPEFGTLAASVSAISDGTDAAAGNILSGKKALVGKNIVTGSMADHSGTSTSTSQIKENGTTAEITIPGGYYDENSKITIPIDVIKDLPAINSNLIANKRIAVKALTATIPTGFGTATAQATFTIPKTCPLLEIEYGATGGYYYSCELFIDDVSQGAGGYQSRTVSKTNVPAGTVIKLVAKRDNPDNLESNVSAYASIAYIHKVIVNNCVGITLKYY